MDKKIYNNYKDLQDKIVELEQSRQEYGQKILKISSKINDLWTQIDRLLDNKKKTTKIKRRYANDIICLHTNTKYNNKYNNECRV